MSICIPTYNRADCLRQTLDSIVSQQEFLDGRVEVVISDNCSTDDTEQMGKEYASRFSSVVYHRNAENVVDRNYPLVMGEGHGLLRKLNNDTATILPGGLAYLCEVAEKFADTKPVLFFSNEKEPEQSSERALCFRDFMLNRSYNVTWIGSFSLWEDDCQGIAEDVDGCQLRLWQVQKLCELGSCKDAVAICDRKIIRGINPPKKNLSYGLWQVFYVNYFQIVDPYVERGVLKQEDRDFLERDLLFNFFTLWVANWELDKGKYRFSETESLKDAVWEHYRTKPYWHEFLRHYRLFKAKLRVKGVAKRLLGRG